MSRLAQRVLLTATAALMICAETDAQFGPYPELVVGNTLSIGNYLDGKLSLRSPGHSIDFDLQVDPVSYDLTLSYFSQTIGNYQSVWYLVEPGDLLNGTSINAHSFPQLGVEAITVPRSIPGQPYSPFLPPQEFFLGVTNGLYFSEPWDSFGWARIRVNPPPNELLPPTLEVVEDAFVYGDPRGIVVGKASLIPEPTTATLFTLALAGLAWRRRR